VLAMIAINYQSRFDHG